MVCSSYYPHHWMNHIINKHLVLAQSGNWDSFVIFSHFLIISKRNTWSHVANCSSDPQQQRVFQRLLLVCAHHHRLLRNQMWNHRLLRKQMWNHRHQRNRMWNHRLLRNQMWMLFEIVVGNMSYVFLIIWAFVCSGFMYQLLTSMYATVYMPVIL